MKSTRNETRSTTTPEVDAATILVGLSETAATSKPGVQDAEALLEVATGVPGTRREPGVHANVNEAYDFHFSFARYREYEKLREAAHAAKSLSGYPGRSDVGGAASTQTTQVTDGPHDRPGPVKPSAGSSAQDRKEDEGETKGEKDRENGCKAGLTTPVGQRKIHKRKRVDEEEEETVVRKRVQRKRACR